MHTPCLSEAALQNNSKPKRRVSPPLSVEASEAIVAAYKAGGSLVDVAKNFGLPLSTARRYINLAGALRSQREGIDLAVSKGKWAKARRERQRKFSDAAKRNMSKLKQQWADKNAFGVSLKPSGYLEITRGPNKGRSVHVVLMEARIGRRLLPDECVHHIDGDKANNVDNNLALLTRAGHARLHRREDILSGNQRRRSTDGQFI